MARIYRRSKKSTVSLTSLLDLLFVMVFVSLLQEKAPPVVKTETKIKTVTKTIIKQVQAPQLVHAIDAKFFFYATSSNPGIPSGKFSMRGTYDVKSNQLHLGGKKWIVKPPVDIGMVSLSGTIDKSKSLFTGRVDFEGCQMFTLKRQSKGSTSPISGSWQGTYSCAQGVTGLTLIIK